MAPRGGGTRAGTVRSGRGGTARRRPRPEDDAPVAYRDLLSSTGTGASTAAPSGAESRPLKRRKVTGRAHHVGASPSSSSRHDDSINSEPSQPVRLRTIIDESDDSDSDIEFEDVDLELSHADVPDPEPLQEKKPLQITIGAQPVSQKRINARKRKPVTTAEKARRLDIHKMHITFLLYHAFYRNHWCNDARTQAPLKRLIHPRVVTMLHPDPSAAQTQKARLFKDGLSQVCDMWYIRFILTALGIRRPQWIIERNDIGKFKLPNHTEKPLERADFRRAAQSLEGSADLSAQLFCALLRAVGVETRLVSSLQPLGFAAAAELGTPQKKTDGKTTVYANESDEEHDLHLETAPTIDTTASPNPIRRIGRVGQSRTVANAPSDLGKPPPALLKKAKRLERPAHPVFWVEAFNDAQQKWIPIDPVATKSVGRPAQIEPAFNDPHNCMSYVIAFEEDGTAKDVTRRYAKSYNAKTRKLRVDSTEGGQRWMNRALRPFRRYRVQDRDQIEDADLAAKEASEGMPRNVQDFKDHPYYALERHLKRNEIIYPKQETGRVNIGTSATTRFEPVYRRRDVHVVRSSDKWFRLGRELKVGEQPLKYARPRQIRGREPSVDPEVEDGGTGLYALFQTNLYVPAPVVDGRITKNAYGNLDVYVPSMVPSGAVHIRYSEAKKAARLLHIDYAEAVTGFQFKGRHGTAVTEGIIIAAEHRDAVESVLDGFVHTQEEAMEARRSAEALRLWRRFLVGLRVVERVKGYRRDGDDNEEDRLADEQFQKELEEEMAQYGDQSPEAGGGGFIVDDDEEDMPIRSARARRSEQQISEGDDDENYDDNENDDYEESGGFLPDEASDEELNARPVNPQDGLLFGLEKFEFEEPVRDPDDEQDDHGGGGFLVDDDEIAKSQAMVLEQAITTNSLCQETGEGPVPKTAEESPPPKETTERPTNNSVEVKLAVERSVEPPEVATAHNGIQVKPSSPILAPASALLSHPENEKIEISISQPEVEKEVKPPAPTVEVVTEESSEYDDDLLLEDPEDEDAEPEWLL